MSQWLIEALRKRVADKRKAMELVSDVRTQAYAEAASEHDAFVSHAQAVTAGINLGTAEMSDGHTVPIRLAWDDEYAHWCVQGGTGSGKTSWISSILRSELAVGRPFGIVDCKGDLFDATIRSIAAMGHSLDPATRGALQKRLVVVNPFGDFLVPFNVCRLLPGASAEVQAYEVTLALARLFEGSLGIHMESILRHLLMLLIDADLTLVEAPLVLQDEVLRGVLASRCVNPRVKQFFLTSYAAIPQVSKDALRNRLEGLLLCENLRLMLGADEILDMRSVFDRGDYLVVFLGKGPGVPEEQVDILGSLIFQFLFQAAYSRGSGQRTPYLVAMDEFFHLLEAPGLLRRFETALTTVRSFGLSMMLIHHNFAQLPASLREIILGNCDLVGLLRTSGRNAHFFGDFLPEVDLDLLARAWTNGRRSEISAQELRRHQMEMLQRLPSRTCFWYDRRKPHRAIRIRVPDVSSAHALSGMKGDAFERMVQEEGWHQGARALPREDLKRQIEARHRRLYELIHAPVILAKNFDDEPAIGKKLPTSTRPKLG